MDWRETEEQGIPVIHLTGEIDLEWSPDLRRVLQAKSHAKCPALVMDFSGVEYIDSSGLATIVEYVRDAGGYEGKIALANLQQTVKTIFEMVRLHEIIPHYPTLDEALSAVSTP